MTEREALRTLLHESEEIRSNTRRIEEKLDDLLQCNWRVRPATHARIEQANKENPMADLIATVGVPTKFNIVPEDAQDVATSDKITGETISTDNGTINDLGNGSFELVAATPGTANLSGSCSTAKGPLPVDGAAVTVSDVATHAVVTQG